MEDFLGVIKFLWIVLALPLAWLWYIANEARKDAKNAKEKVSALELQIAKDHFDKSEVRLIITESIKPVLNMLVEIKRDIRELIKENGVIE